MSSEQGSIQKGVAWLRKQVLGATNENPDGFGLSMSVSDNSGIVKIELPETGRRSPVLYRDEILFLLDHAQTIREYLAANEDVAFSKDVSKDARKIKRGQERVMRQAVTVLSALSPEQIQAIADQIQKQKVG